MRSPRTYVTLNEELDKAVKATALHRGISESQVIRECVEEQMKVQASIDNIDLITKIVREQLQMLMDGYIERLASISSKGAIMSATSTYLTAETISRLLPLDLQTEYQTAYEQARKKGIAYIKSKRTED